MTKRFDRDSCGLRENHGVVPLSLTLDEAVSAANDYVTRVLLNVSQDFQEMTAHISSSLGKGIRTVLLLNAASDMQGMVSYDAVKMSAAVELLHIATLVHDDVIDDALLRRGIASVQSRFGRKQAVICGDYLLCTSLSIASSITAKYRDKHTDMADNFTKALCRICLGELNQYKNNSNLDLELFSYLRIIMNKTAALFYISAQSGALIGDMEPAQMKAVARFGQYLGVVFQVIDDCKDYEQSESVAKKTVGKDISDGVVTLPLIMAMMKNPEVRGLASDVIAGGDAAALIAEVRRLGGTEDARRITRKYEKKALRELDRLTDAVKRQRLADLLDKALNSSAKF